MSQSISSIPFGYCHCNCGGKTTVPTKTHRRHGRIKGVPMAYISGHNRSVPPIDADRPHKDKRRCACGSWRDRNAPKCRDCWNKEGKPPIDLETYWIEGKPRRKIPLTQGQYAIVDEHNYERMMKFHYYAHWSPLKQAFYAKRSLSIGGGKSIPIPMQYDVKTAPDGQILDHIKSEETLNNCADNLRSADRFGNMQNRRTGSNNTSGRKNVYKVRNRFIVRIGAFGVEHYIGSYSTFVEACEVQERAIQELHGEFARF